MDCELTLLYEYLNDVLFLVIGATMEENRVLRSPVFPQMTWNVIDGSKSLPNARSSLFGRRDLLICVSHFDCE
jgi:hypothetical protein